MIRRLHVSDWILIGYGVAMIALAIGSALAAKPALALRALDDPLDLRSIQQRLDVIEWKLDVLEQRLRINGYIAEPAPRRWIKG